MCSDSIDVTAKHFLVHEERSFTAWCRFQLKGS